MKGVRMNRARMVIVLLMLIVLAVTLTGAFLTHGVMAYLPFLQARTGNWTGAYVPPGVVDQRPWQTAATGGGRVAIPSANTGPLALPERNPALPSRPYLRRWAMRRATATVWTPVGKRSLRSWVQHE